LDERLSKVIKCIAIQENYFKSRNSNSNSIIQNVFENKHLIEQYRFETLSSLIIFGKIYSNSYNLIDNNTERFSIDHKKIDFSTLINEGVFEFINVKDDNIKDTVLNTKIADFEMFKDLIIQGTEHYLKFNNNNKYNQKDLIQAHTELSNIIKDRKNQLDDYFIQNLEEVEFRDFTFYHELILENPDESDLIESMVLSYRNIASTIKSANNNNIYSKLSIPNLSINKFNSVNISNDYIQVYKVILEEDITFPFPRTLNDAIKLSRDKRIEEFRNILNYWVTALNDNNLDDLSSLRLEIKKAKVDLTKIKQMKKIGKIVSYISLPVSVASIFLQLPLGIILAPIGPAINLKNYFTEQKHKWLSFGKWQ
jgi:hypothetical protein